MRIESNDNLRTESNFESPSRDLGLEDIGFLGGPEEIEEKKDEGVSEATEDGEKLVEQALMFTEENLLSMDLKKRSTLKEELLEIEGLLER